MNRSGECLSRLGAALLVAAFVAMAAPRAHAGARIVNGVDSQDYPTTGALLYGGGGGPINANNAGLQCSGTLIGCQTFLTAAHCVYNDLASSHYQVYLQNAGLLAVSSVAYNPAYVLGESGNDIAVVKLAAPVTGIAPTRFNSTHDLAAIGVGLAGTIVGFGETAGSANDYAIKRAGDVVTADCNLAATGGEGNDVLVCFDFAAPLGAPGSNSDTCYGDSGGPLFVDFAGTTEVVAATSSGSSNTCQTLDHAWDVSVYHNAAWVAAQLGADPTSVCGALSPVGDEAVLLQHDSGSLGSANLDDSFTVTLPAGVQTVRLTMNGTDNNVFNPNFFVKQGTGASATSFDCKADGASAFGACEFADPAPGTWSIFVQRVVGSGQYQVTTTIFGTGAPLCGNNIVESGEQCDGSDLGSCLVGPCTACACPAPVCGNDVVEDGEQCDGTADSACPGLCAGDCTCSPPCSSGDLATRALVSNASRLSYRALLSDPAASYAALDPRADELRLQIADGAASVDVAIPAADAGWYRADAVRRRYAWKGDGGNGGLLRARLTYKDVPPTPHWTLTLRGRAVPGAAAINSRHVLDYTLSFDGTCNKETQ